MKQIPTALIPVGVGILTLLFVFMVRGPLTAYPDTKVYLGQIGYFQGTVEPDMDIQLRSFKPFYGIVGSWLAAGVGPEVALLLINIAFLFGLIVSSYYLLKELGFSETYSAVGASWIGTGYPLLKYGLALLTDISGWFFAAATIAVFLAGMRKNSTSLLLASSVIAFIGSLCKETGILGLGFAGLYLLLHCAVSRNLSYLKKIAFISLPFVALQAAFLYILFTKSSAHTSFIQWFFFNKEGVGYELHTLYHFILTELSTFSLLWVYGAFGLYAAWNYRKSITREQRIIGISLLVTVLPPLVWPVFLTRVLYIGYLALVPLALIGLAVLHRKYPNALHTLAVLPIVSAVALFFLAGGRSLFPMLESILQAASFNL